MYTKIFKGWFIIRLILLNSNKPIARLINLKVNIILKTNFLIILLIGLIIPIINLKIVFLEFNNIFKIRTRKKLL